MNWWIYWGNLKWASHFSSELRLHFWDKKLGLTFFVQVWSATSSAKELDLRTNNFLCVEFNSDIGIFTEEFHSPTHAFLFASHLLFSLSQYIILLNCFRPPLDHCFFCFFSINQYEYVLYLVYLWPLAAAKCQS